MKIFRFRLRLCLILCSLMFSFGCASGSKWVSVRSTPKNPLTATLNLASYYGPKPSERTEKLLRQIDLSGDLKSDRQELLMKLNKIQLREPHPELQHAIAELAYIEGKRLEKSDMNRAIEFYGSALLHSYNYLFSSYPNQESNPYDPQFRGACDLYNQSLEGTLRIAKEQGHLRPGHPLRIKTTSGQYDLDIVVKSSGWKNSDFDRIEFVSDYQVRGLRNHHHRYGLGVPLIAIRKSKEEDAPQEKYYPRQLCFPVTAFLRIDTPPKTTLANQAIVQANHTENEPSTKAPFRFVLELYDPSETSHITINQQQVPLETDLSAPLAYFLDQPDFNDNDLSTLGLLQPDKSAAVQGFYMLEPYRKEKIPVVMVHGLWSSPITWMEMFNDLQSDPVIRERYQFWFYLYPTGQPFWVSAAQMRKDMDKMRKVLDPNLENQSLNEMVLVGHSMGGLVARLQTTESQDDFWKTVSDHPLAELEADEETRKNMESVFYFKSNPSISRVVTIGTPHRGSKVANSTTKWLGRKFIETPQKLLRFQRSLLTNQDGFFKANAPLNITTSIESLDPSSPLFPPLLSAKSNPHVQYHNIVGKTPLSKWMKWFANDEEGDGVVSLASARLDNLPQVFSQLVVPSDHISIHRHPQSVLEVRRILHEQLAEIASHQATPREEYRTLPASAHLPAVKNALSSETIRDNFKDFTSLSHDSKNRQPKKTVAKESVVKEPKLKTNEKIAPATTGTTISY